MKLAVRILALALVVLALIVLAIDIGDAPEGGAVRLMPLGQVWYDLHPGSLNLVQAVIERYVWEPLWDPVLAGVLRWPAAPAFGGLGVVLLAITFLGRRAPKDETEDEPESSDE